MTTSAHPVRLALAAQAWGTDAFAEVLRCELEQLDPGWLPLQQALSVSSVVSASPHQVRIISVTDLAGQIRVRAGIFYAGVIAGCSCADDPTPVDEQTEYCEVQLDVDPHTAEARVTLLPEA